MFPHEKINQLTGGWYAVFNDGTVVTEEEMPWSMVEGKKNVRLIGLKWRHKAYELEGKESYVPPGETHLRDISIGSDNEIRITKSSLVSRFIGYYDTDCKVIVRVDTDTGKFYEERISYK